MEERLIREGMLIGDEGLEKLNSAHVAVFGLGGVGSWCAEALARSGIGELTLVDCDDFSESNINRQLGASYSALGRRKTAVTAERLLDVNPKLSLHPIDALYSTESRSLFFPEGSSAPYSFAADCIDLVSCKLDLIMTCRQCGVPVISALGTGNKLDAQQLRIADLAETSGCALARVMRRELRARGIEHSPVVFSPELPTAPLSLEAPPPGRRSVPGSVIWVPATAGMLMAQYIIGQLLA